MQYGYYVESEVRYRAAPTGKINWKRTIKLLFHAIIQMLKNIHAEKKNAFFYGTTHFHTVWENLVNLTFGIEDKVKKEYFPPADWYFIDSISQTKGNKLLPTILLHEGKVFVWMQSIIRLL